MMHLWQLGAKIVQVSRRGEILLEDLLGTIVEASRNPQHRHLQATPDCRPRQTALYVANPCDRTVNRRHALLLLDLKDLRVAYRQSRFQVHQAEEETEVVAMTISTVASTDLPNKDYPVKDLRVIEAARERQRETQEILMGLNVVIGMTARGPGGFLPMHAILVKSLAALIAASPCRHSKCPLLKVHETIFARHTSGNICLHSRCLTPMV